MLHKTRGIVFKYFKYRDTSIVTKIFTEEFGLQSYIVNGVRSSKARGKIAFYQPLTLLDMVVYKKPNADINRISELKCTHPLKTIPYNIFKSSIGVFLAEVLYKCIKEGEADHSMFNFIYHSIEVLDELDEHYQNFHLQFLIKLSHHMGFGLSDVNELPHIIDDEMIIKVREVLSSKYGDAIIITSRMRRDLLHDIISFYITYVDSLKDINSMKVLQTVFEE